MYLLSIQEAKCFKFTVQSCEQASAWLGRRNSVLFLTYSKPHTSAPLVKVNSTYMKHKVWPCQPCCTDSSVHRARYSTNWDRKGWPGSEIQMYYSFPWNIQFLLLNPTYLSQTAVGIDFLLDKYCGLHF